MNSLRNVLLAVVLIWGAIFAPSLAPHVISPSHWFEVRRVFVEDSEEGVPPVVVPDRSIHRDFTGSWTAYVRRIDGAAFSDFCRRSSPERFRYFANNEIGNQPRDLRWWLEIPPNPDCVDRATGQAWPVGQYGMVTVWTIYLPFNVRLEVERMSNTFTIWPKGERPQHPPAQ